jgi:glucosamine-6-phosphate deaminase
MLYGQMPHTLLLPGTELDYDAKWGDPKRGIRPEFRPLEMGHWFKKAGYDCVYAGKWHVGQWGPTESLQHVHGSGFRPLCPIQDDEVPRACTKYFQTANPAKKFLMVASFDNPHNICEFAMGDPLPWGPLPAEPPLEALPPLPANFYQTPDEPLAIRQLRSRAQELCNYDVTGWRRYRWAYYRLVEKLDQQIGKLIQGLETTGLMEQTAIIFTADHGDMQAAHGLREKDTFYEESVHVPLLLRLPGGKQGTESDRLVNTGLDIYPTLCELAGLAPPPGLHGASLLSASRCDYVAAEQKFRFGGGEARMICSGRFKYVAYDKGPVREQLFDLQNDPGEMENLAKCAAFFDERLRHREFLRHWLTLTKDPFGSGHYTHPGRHIAVPGDQWAER